ncbi:MAG: hypothetical protein K4571_01445 [Deltaproteobacteria bacterium]
MPNDYLHNDAALTMAWSPWFAHEYLTYYSVQAVHAVTALPPVAVKANPRYGDKLWPVSPKHIDVYKESYQERRQLDPLWSFDDKKRNGDYALNVPAGKIIEPWKVLVIYSTEPDLYLDYDLVLHKNQKITGGSHGWRHMHFKMLGTTYGIAPQAFRVHKDLAKLALENGNEYWGWRYLSRAGHYLADLGHPFHVKGLPLSFLVRKYFARHELFKIVTAIHQSYEVYVERRFREGFEPFRQALLAGASEGQAAGLAGDAQLRAYIKRAEKKHNPIFYHLLEQFGPELQDAFAQMDQNYQLDAAAQTKRCSAGAARVIFKDANRPELDDLDKITAGLLFDVGRMLGGLFSGFVKERMSR